MAPPTSATHARIRSNIAFSSPVSNLSLLVINNSSDNNGPITLSYTLADNNSHSVALDILGSATLSFSLLHRTSQFLAHSRHATRSDECPFLGRGKADILTPLAALV